jgi:WhiB family transcriptional regulator, redox-sensing transcriptional regulator
MSTTAQAPEARQIPRRDWEDDAACRVEPQVLFYGTDLVPVTTPKQARAAFRICARCPVERDCLLAALRNKESFGVRAGFLAPERRKALKLHGSVEAAMTAYDRGEFLGER